MFGRVFVVVIQDHGRWGWFEGQWCQWSKWVDGDYCCVWVTLDRLPALWVFGGT